MLIHSVYSGVEHVLNVDVRRTSRYAQYAIMYAKCAKHDTGQADIGKTEMGVGVLRYLALRYAA